MSWLRSLNGSEPAPYVAPVDEVRVKDPSIPDRMVSNKRANQPFLQYAKYREEQERKHKEYLKRKMIRDEKIARGEKVGPPERDPMEVTEIGVLDILKFLVCFLVVTALAGKFITNSYTWEYKSKWLKLKTYMPANGPSQRLFSEQMLARFDGSLPDKPIYLAIDGEVYDVSTGKAYQPGGSYHILAGVDAARAFGTGCFKTHRTHDLRGLTESELAGVEHWKKFYRESDKYSKVGRVQHHPIDPTSPIPEHCNPQKSDAEKNPKKRTPENQRGAKGKEL